MAEKILSITQLNEYIRCMMDSDSLLSGVAVSGEISNYKLYPSGHHYFTLKDDNASLKCVMFKGNAFRLRFRPENGMKIIAFGRISVYPRDGAYQLYCTALTLGGVGDLHAAFEQLKKKLDAKGLFDPAHKKPIPAYPSTIGIITSSAGAAIHDMLRILKKRYPLTQVKLLPVRVQGAEAPDEIVAAIKYANIHNLADVLIVGRGGGSIEDLWAFNDESVAYAIYDSHIPVISAVGHEPDVTIADYVADLRAATPSNAAELVVKDQLSIRQYLDQIASAMGANLTRQVTASRQRLSILRRSPALQSPIYLIEQRRDLLHTTQDKIISAALRNNSLRRNRYIALASKLDAMSPLKVMTRGYALVADDSGNMLTSVSQTSVGDQIDVRLSDGKISAKVSQVEEYPHE